MQCCTLFICSIRPGTSPVSQYSPSSSSLVFFFFNDTATTEIYTLSLHDALPICQTDWAVLCSHERRSAILVFRGGRSGQVDTLAEEPDSQYLQVVAGGQKIGLFRSEEHTSELQSHLNLVCRLLLEKKKTRITTYI